MDQSLRDEITLLSCIFCFCLLSIPLTLLTFYPEEVLKQPSSINHLSSTAEWRKRLFIDSVEILEKLNEKNKRNDELGFSYLMNLSRVDAKRGRINSSVGRFDLRMKSVWSKFDFKNGTVLRSKSLKLPLKVDWREKRVVSEVQKQNSCGSCYAVSVIETAESMHAIKTGIVTSLSVQQMLDCNGYHMNCKGGNPCGLLNWLLKTQTRLQTADEYAYVKSVTESQKCDFGRRNTPGVKIKDYSCNSFTNHEELILLYLAHQGPLVAALNATPLKHYVNGIVQHNCDSQLKSLNHVVQIVGYDLTEGIPFYIVKNSWGVDWGIKGYLKIAIGSNVCGIAHKISSIVIDG